MISYEKFNTAWITQATALKPPRGNPHGRKTKYLEPVTAFDIETSGLMINDEPHSVCYLWQFAWDETEVFYGRTIQEAGEFLRACADAVPDGCMLVCYVFNLSYEFQFLSGVYTFEPGEVFAVKPHKVLKCTMYKKIEFRDAYLHSNDNLKGFLKKMGVQHQKLSGTEYDYKKTRYPWTPLTAYELEYGQNDVLGLVEALKKEMAHDGDDLYTIPLTSTGYVRRDAKEAMRGINHKWLRSMQPDYLLYLALLAAFRGGDTHANRWYVGLINEHVIAQDKSSSYPSVLLNHEYPMTPFKRLQPCSAATVLRMIEHFHRAVLLHCIFRNIRLKDQLDGFPYLSKSKLLTCQNEKIDNGRVLEAELVEMWITDIDYKIITQQYAYDDFRVAEAYYATYKPLPESFREIIREYYRKKTALKGVESAQVEYIKSKAKLNSLYGMTAMRSVRDELVYDRHTGEWTIKMNSSPVKQLEDYSRKAFLCYQWGVWCTAWARWELHRALEIVDGRGRENGHHRGLYCDTDSVYYIRQPDILPEFEELNKNLTDESITSGAWADDPAGHRHYMGVWEVDADNIDRFKAMGAKKYAYEKDGKLKLTVAGVSKSFDDPDKDGAHELAEHGGLEAFDNGFTFVKAGGTESIYNNIEPFAVEIDGHSLIISNNVYIRDSTYTLGQTDDYLMLLFTCREVLNLINHKIDEFMTLKNRDIDGRNK